jgi:NAD(P)H-flavin reductase
MARFEVGDSLSDVLGPLGRPSEIEKWGTVMLVGGGVGIAALFPILRELKRVGNYTITVLGAGARNW